MSSNSSMGSPAPTKTPEPPRGEAGEGEIEVENLTRMIAGEIREIIIKHLFGDDAIDISPSDHYEWNGWIVRDWGEGKYFKDFRAGSYWEYVRFSIIVLKALINELKEMLEWFEWKDRELDEEWEAVMRR